MVLNSGVCWISLYIDMPDLSVVANTDLRVGLHNRALQVDGELIIPKAMIRPRISQDLHVSESEDVVIIAGDDDFSVRVLTPDHF